MTFVRPSKLEEKKELFRKEKAGSA